VRQHSTPRDARATLDAASDPNPTAADVSTASDDTTDDAATDDVAAADVVTAADDATGDAAADDATAAYDATDDAAADDAIAADDATAVDDAIDDEENPEITDRSSQTVALDTSGVLCMTDKVRDLFVRLLGSKGLPLRAVCRRLDFLRPLQRLHGAATRGNE